MFLTKLKALDEYLIKALIKDWIQEFKSSANASVLFILRKSDELWFCIDYHALNVMMIKNCYSLSLINKLLDWLDNSVMFLKINLWNTYHHICICKEDEWKTVFHTQYDYFEFLVVLFDLTNISAIFQVYINCALHELVDNFCIIYLDDILIFSRTEAEHFCHLEHMIECLQCVKLYVNLKKCEFFKTEVEYLDFVIDKESI